MLYKYMHTRHISPGLVGLIFSFPGGVLFFFVGKSFFNRSGTYITKRDWLHLIHCPLT